MTRTPTRSSSRPGREIPFLQPRQPLLRLPRRSPGSPMRRRADRRRPARARASAWAHAAAAASAALPGRALPPRRRRQPLRSAQPPGDLRADPPVDAPAPGAAGGVRRRERDRVLAAVALAPEHQLLGQRDPRRRRGSASTEHGLGDAEVTVASPASRVHDHELAVVGGDLARQPGLDAASLR